MRTVAFGLPCEFEMREFLPRPKRHWTFSFPNGYGASVIGGPYCYGDGVRTFELAVLKHGRLYYYSPLTDDVLGWLNKEEVIQNLKKIQSWEA